MLFLKQDSSFGSSVNLISCSYGKISEVSRIIRIILLKHVFFAAYVLTGRIECPASHWLVLF